LRGEGRKDGGSPQVSGPRRLPGRSPGKQERPRAPGGRVSRRAPQPRARLSRAPDGSPSALVVLVRASSADGSRDRAPAFPHLSSPLLIPTGAGGPVALRAAPSPQGDFRERDSPGQVPAAAGVIYYPIW